MATSNTLSSIEPLLKRNYTPKVMTEIYQRDYPLMARLTKQSGVGGNPMHVPYILSQGAGVASTLTAAQATAVGVTSGKFLVEPGDIVGIVPLNTKTQQAAEGNAGGGKGALADYVKTEIDAKLSMAGSLGALQIFSNGGAALGRRASAAGNVITLTDPADAINFWPSMQLVASTGTGASSGDALKGGTPYTVVSVDRNLGTVTVDNIANVSGNADNDYLFNRGMFAGNVSQTQIMKGLAAWITLTAATDTLWGVARTNFPELSGFRVTSPSGSVVKRLKDLSTHGFATLGARPRTAVLHPKQWDEAATTMQAQGYRLIEVGETSAMAGYTKLTLAGVATGSIEMVADPQCQTDRAYLLDLDTWKLFYLGSDFLQFSKDDKGAMWIPSTTEVGHELRIIGFANLACNAPWKNGVTSLTALS